MFFCNYWSTIILERNCKILIRTYVERAKSGYKFGYNSGGNMFCTLDFVARYRFDEMFLAQNTRAKTNIWARAQIVRL